MINKHMKNMARILEWVPFPSPGDLPNPGIEPGSPALQADSLLTELSGSPVIILRFYKSFLDPEGDLYYSKFYQVD